MHDIKFIRENPDAFDAALKRRPTYPGPWAKDLLELDKASRGGKTEIQALQARRNEVAKAIGEAMRTDKAKAEELKKEAAEIKAKLAALEGGEGESTELTDALMRIPNLLADDVPAGADESANKEVRRGGTKPSIANPKQHFELGEALEMMDFETAAKMSGTRFVLTKGPLARLERALASFMLDMHTAEFGYTETNPPFLVKDNALMGTGQLPKFKDDLFRIPPAEMEIKESQIFIDAEGQAYITNEEQKNFIQHWRSRDFPVKLITSESGPKIVAKSSLWLIPTAEVSLTNIVADTISEEASLPRRYTAWTPCFRSEAGSAGKDTRGMIRLHQFSKVELVSITKPDDSVAEHERMTNCAEEVLKRLGLHYRIMLLCAGDTGFGSQKTYDFEVWLPGQDAFREISSCSNCGDFQARRMKARYRTDKGTQFVHTLNGSGLAVGRTLVAIMENYQESDGSIAVPEVLQPYMGGLKVIRK